MTEGVGLDGGGMEASCGVWASRTSLFVASAALTWSAQDLLGHGSVSMSMSASLATLRA